MLGNATRIMQELIDEGCGRPLGRYVILRRLAQGGMAEVYLARARGIEHGRRLAIKRVHPQHARTPSFIDMLIDEARISAHLSHPNIAQVLSLEVDARGAPFIVMEYVEGCSLSELMRALRRELKRTELPFSHAAYLAAEIAKGLDYAHSLKDSAGRRLGIIHRDITPQNVMISVEGRVKLIDFGIARAAGRGSDTIKGVIKGKLRYLAPELLLGMDPDHRADIYCCGLVLFQMLTGERMYSPKTYAEAFELAKSGRVRSPREVNPLIPPELEEICMRALCFDREQRYATAAQLFFDLRAFLSSECTRVDSDELSRLLDTLFKRELAYKRALDSLAEELAVKNVGLVFEEETDRQEDVLEAPTMTDFSMTSGIPMFDRSSDTAVTRY
jgi:eukaryotic-like serine/threonine-protein kinase